MIQDIYPHCFSNEFLTNSTIGSEDFVLHYRGDSLLLDIRDSVLKLPRRRDIPEISDDVRRTFLFSLDSVPCFLIWDNPCIDQPGFSYHEISLFRTIEQREIAWVTITGFQLMNWYLENRFCGKCGAKTKQKNDERAVICLSCETIVYPKIAPAIIVAITCGDRLLLARSPRFPVRWFSLIAGYADVGESLEETVVREVKEEVGLDVTNIRYYTSQPWPLSGSMMIGFTAEADDAQPIVIDDIEIAEAAWFTRGNLPKYPPKLSIAGEMIQKFENGEL